MKKKIHPKDQTKELNRAKFEILKRNPEKLKEIQELIEKNEKGLDEYATRMATISGECNQKLKESWKFFLSETFFDKDYKAKVLETETFPACNAVAYQGGFMAYIKAQIMLHGIENLPYMTKDETNGQYFMTKDAMNEKMLDYLCKNARQIFTDLTNAQPTKHLLMGIDLLREKEVIRVEVFEMITQHKDMTGTEFEGIPQKRFKWLPNADEYMEVWDLRSVGKSFSEIKELLSIKIDSAKKRFYRAFSLVTGKEYDKNIWKALFRTHLEHIAKTEKPTDKHFWNQVLKTETVSQIDLIPKNIKDEDGNERTFIESVGQEGGHDLRMLISDLKNICSSCPDISCRTETVKCLTEFEAGDMGAFEDFKPDCPKFYKYLEI